MDRTHLVFGLQGTRYGIDAAAVREIVWLPELQPAVELPAHFAGAFNLRGRVAPVMDLALRLGQASAPRKPSDRVIVLDCGETRFGVIADELRDVLPIPPALIEDAERMQAAGGRARFVRGEAKLPDGVLVAILDVEALLRAAPAENVPPPPEPPAELRELLRERARALAAAPESERREGLERYAVIRLGGELFGLGLAAVREFAHLRGVVPVPCCPPHVVGDMNLRGDILTVIDLRPALGMPLEDEPGEVAVVEAGGVRAGIRAAEIVDVIALAPADIAPLPAAATRAGRDYCKGTAALHGRAVSLLEVERILAARALRVDETVPQNLELRGTP
jgi:purine-binding chemotaxis protein CheW